MSVAGMFHVPFLDVIKQFSFNEFSRRERELARCELESVYVCVCVCVWETPRARAGDRYPNDILYQVKAPEGGR